MTGKLEGSELEALRQGLKGVTKTEPTTALRQRIKESKLELKACKRKDRLAQIVNSHVDIPQHEQIHTEVIAACQEELKRRESIKLRERNLLAAVRLGLLSADAACKIMDQWTLKQESS